jgi:hypothetical protein
MKTPSQQEEKPRRVEPSTSKTKVAATFKQQEKAPKRIVVPPNSRTLTKNKNKERIATKFKLRVVSEEKIE